VLLPRTHIQLDVDDAGESAAFYEALFGAPPARRSAGMAVFEFDSPPLVLTLRSPPLDGRAKKQPDSGSRRSRKPHKGHPMFASRCRFALVVTQPEHVGDAAIALRRAGVRLLLEDQGLEAHDPDGNAWRVRFVPFAGRRSVVAI
jgi:catechol 2,3-dioxygenase-like lactoylglutathione lyase family enzyme